MTKTGPRLELAALRRLIKEVEVHFVVAHLGPPRLSPPGRDEILHVAAYAVLVHGALENFIEGLALWVVGRSVANWTKHKRMTRSTASLLLYQTAPSEDGQLLSVFDNIRTALDLAKNRVSKSVFDNNGITLDHLKTLPAPRRKCTRRSRLDRLPRTARHDAAPVGASVPDTGAKVIRSAKDAQTTVSDCLTLAERLSAEAVAVRP